MDGMIYKQLITDAGDIFDIYWFPEFTIKPTRVLATEDDVSEVFHKVERLMVSREQDIGG
jgi:hypothetical protein